MKKFHINNAHKVCPCNASKKPCPYASNMHFDSKLEANRVLEKLNSTSFGVLYNNKINIPPEIMKTLSAIKEQGGHPYLVGGMVRNHLLGVKEQDRDFDFEVYGLSENKLASVLSKFGNVDLVGKQFGVFKLSGLHDVDFSLPRTEIKTGDTHKDFDVKVDSTLSFQEAAKRRDLTINAIMFDPFTNEIIDPYNGVNDIHNKVLKYIDKDRFKEDPLRVLRVAGFKARLGFEVDENLSTLCKQMVNDGMLNNLPPERIFNEHEKILVRSSKPSLGYKFLKEVNFLPKQLRDLVGCEQNEKYHPEGDVFEHTMLTIDEGAKVKHKTKNELGFMLSCLLHDTGKPEDMATNGNTYTHSTIGKKTSLQYLKDMKASNELCNYVQTMTEFHMKPLMLSENNSSDKHYLRLLKNIENKVSIHDLILLSKCDKRGRAFAKFPAVAKMDTYFKDMISKHGSKAHSPLVKGDDLLELGVKPSQEFGKMLNFAYDLQTRGHSKNSIINILTTQYINKNRGK